MATVVVVLAFAKYREDLEPNPVNRLIGKRAEVIINFLEETRDELARLAPHLPLDEVYVISQWEPARQLEADGYTVHHVVTLEDGSVRSNGMKYLGTEDVVDATERFMMAYAISDVVVVANPFIHLGATQRMFEKRGFNVLKYKIEPVGFDPSPQNLQWWCKGPVRMMMYLGIQVIGKLIRRDLHGIGERKPDR